MEHASQHIRRHDERGAAEHGWLSSRHSFSFGSYYDPDHMGFRALRVINDDRVQPGQGFGTHPHRDMEILSFVVEGELKHRDSLGNGSVIRPGEVRINGHELVEGDGLAVTAIPAIDIIGVADEADIIVFDLA